MRHIQRTPRSLSLVCALITALIIAGCGGDDDEPAQQSTSAIPAAVKTAFGADPNKDDTDGDGLSDEFEIKFGYPYLKPALKDTNGNGISDADEDTDSDGLTNLQEQQYRTNPLTADSDSDGLSDKEELFTRKTDPNNTDTDGDGIADGREVVNGTNPLVADASLTITSKKDHLVFDPTTGLFNTVRVEILGQGDLSGAAQVTKRASTGLPFETSHRYDIKLPADQKAKMQSAVITLPYDPTTSGALNDTDFIILTIDPATGFFEPLTTSANSGNRTLTASTTHFSDFIAVIKSKYDAWVTTLPKGCIPADDPNAQIADVVLVIDSSGSMVGNDPSGLRRTAAKKFIEAMKSGDRAAIVDFDSSSRIAIGLSNNQTAISSAINTIDSSGGTNIGAGISTALNLLKSGSDPSKLRAIFLLTDGDGSYDSNLTTQASAAGIRIFTVGLTGAVNDNLLSSIASGTGGAYKKLADANGLVGLFTEFSQVFGDTGKDSDGDGLTDCQETYGIFVTSLGRFVTSDPNNKNSDTDGIEDGLEVGQVTLVTIPLLNTKAVVGNGMSDPRMGDTDGDGLTDDEEYDEDTNPSLADSDGDRISDVTELEQGSDPNDPSDPNEPEILDKSVWRQLTGAAYILGGFSEGLVFGEFADIDTWPELAGITGRNFIPSCGVLDGLDTIAANNKGDKVSAGLSFAGAASGGGQCVTVVASIFSVGAAAPTAIAATGVDTAAAIAREGRILINFLKAVGYTQKNTRKVYRLLEKHNIIGITVHDILAPALKQLDPSAFSALEKAGLNSEDIVKAMSGIRRGEIAQKLGSAGEKAVERVYKIGKKSPFKVNGRNRIADGLNDFEISEVKNVKFQRLTKQIQDYIDYAPTIGKPFVLYLRNVEAIDAGLKAAVAAGKVTIKPIIF